MTHQLRGILALFIVTIVWGTTFPAMKDLTASFSPVWIIFLRFALADLVLCWFLLRGGVDRGDVASGVLLGVLLFFSFMFQVESLALISSNRNAFICGLNVLVVPLLGVLAGRLPEPRILAALVLAVAGLTALCWDGGGWGRGENLALLAALSFGVYVKVMEVRTRTAKKLMSVTATQVSTVAACAGLWLAVCEAPHDWAGLTGYLGQVAATAADYWINFAYLGLVATAGIISLQTWGQSRTTANEAAVVYSFEPAAAALFGFFWLGEIMTERAWLGAALLISGMIVSQWNSESRPSGALAPE